MALRLVRQSSDTPNITNKDDVKMIRYAYGGFDGVIKNYGNELNSVTPSEDSLFKIGSGRVVLQGWEVDVDEIGWELHNDGLLGTRFYTIYLEISVATETANIKSIYDANLYPEVSKGDDLNQIPSGTSRLVLWQVEVSNNNVVNANKVVETIPYIYNSGNIKLGDNIIPYKKLIWSGSISLKGNEHIPEVPQHRLKPILLLDIPFNPQKTYEYKIARKESGVVITETSFKLKLTPSQGKGVQQIVYSISTETVLDASWGNDLLLLNIVLGLNKDNKLNGVAYSSIWREGMIHDYVSVENYFLTAVYEVFE